MVSPRIVVRKAGVWFKILLFLMPAAVMEHYTLSGNSSALAYWMLFVSLFLLASVADLSSFLSAVRNEFLAKDWPQASATIKSHKFETESLVESGQKYIAMVFGDYFVGATRFTKAWRWESTWTSDVWAEAAQEFPIGSTRLVRYNPLSPETCVDNGLVIRAHGVRFWSQFMVTTTYKLAFVALEVWIYLCCLKDWMASNQPGLARSIEGALLFSSRGL